MSDVMIPWESIANYGVLGVVLLWFMFRTEKHLENNTKAISALCDVVDKLIAKLDTM